MYALRNTCCACIGLSRMLQSERSEAARPWGAPWRVLAACVLLAALYGTHLSVGVMMVASTLDGEVSLSTLRGEQSTDWGLFDGGLTDWDSIEDPRGNQDVVGGVLAGLPVLLALSRQAQPGSHPTTRQANVQTRVQLLERRFVFSGLDGHVVLYNLPRRSAMICVNAKGGSSRWKMLLHKAMGDKSFLHHSPHMLTMKWLSPAQMSLGALQAPETLSFILVRNPYVRALSGYLDKIHMDPLPSVNNKLYGKKLGPRHYQLTDQRFRSSFGQYVHFINGTGRDLLKDVHFKPISEQCFSMRNDVVLRVEEIHEWYPELIRFLGIEEHARKGWAEESEWNLGSQADRECFYPRPDGDCDHWSVGVGTPDGLHSMKEVEGSTGGAKTMHATNAAGKLAEHYTPALAATVTKIYARDLRTYHYPHWNGVLEDFKVVGPPI
jgi:hypothetical protein